MKKKYSYIFIFLLFISAFKPVNKDTEFNYRNTDKNIKTDEKWQFSVNVKRHLDMTENTATICGDPCNCTRIDFHSISDIEYSFSGETDVIPQGSDVLVKLESDNVGGKTTYTHTNISTDLCIGKSCTETASTHGKIKTAGGYFDYKPSSKEGLLLMNYGIEGSGEGTDCYGPVQFYNCWSYLVAMPQYMNFSLNDEFDSLLSVRKREYDSLQHLLPDWMPRIDFEQIEKSRQEQKNDEQTTDSVSYTDKYALKVTEKESGYIATVSYTKTIEIPYKDLVEAGKEGFTKYTFTENITIEVGARSDIILKQISKDWVPEKDSLLDVTVKWQGAKLPSKLKFTIYDVSAEPGVCLNSEDKNLLPDLEFDWDGLFDFEKISETEVIVKSGAFSGNECIIRLKSKDFGMYAKLKAEGDFGNGWEPIEADETDENFIRIPYDKDDDKIADKWETDNNVKSLPPDWDEDPEPQTLKHGDAISLYEEYRGFFVLDPDKKHVRTDPNKREIFVIDMDELFSVPAWKTASGIMAYRLDNSMVKGGTGVQESRIVDFNQKYSAGVHKYSIRLIKSSETGGDDGKVTLGECFPETSVRKPPKYWDRTVIYVDAINFFSDRAIRKLERENNQTDEKLKQVTGLTREQFNRLHEVISNASVVSTIKEFFINRTVLHEVGHSCAVDHHDPLESGSLSCPMKYGDTMDDYTYIKDFLMEILEFISASGEGETIISFGNSKFCGEFDCYNDIQVRDD
jgi:hypothetical protein